jgi:hypothetical protein
MSYAPALADIDQDKQISHGDEYLLGPERRLSAQLFLAPARTIKEMLSKHHIYHIDFMVLDLEGAEIEALRGMDFHICRVGAILLEAREARHLSALDGFLLAQGYGPHSQLSEHDYLYRAKAA